MTPAPLAFLLDGKPTAEQVARLRELRALAMLMLGPAHPATQSLARAASDPAAADAALDALATLPALSRRRLLSNFSALS